MADPSCVRLPDTTKRHLTDGTTAGLMAHHRERPLTVYEKKFLLCVERGDTVSVRKFLTSHQNLTTTGKFSIDCHDPLGRTALILAIENENMDMIELLLSSGASLGDSLLHAISEEYVEAVEALLKHEEQIHKPGTPYSWELADSFSSIFTRDISPLILAAHKNNYEILKLLLDRGAAIPLPHDAKCSCKDCLIESKSDYLRHSRARINAYRALASPSLIALSSRDPILTAFQLSWELRRLSRIEKEFAIEYKQLREQVQTFAVSLLDHIRTSQELRIVLNCNPLWFQNNDDTVDSTFCSNENMDRIRLAIEFKQKQFVAHPSVQQVLGAVWYSGCDDFGRKGPFIQLLIVIWMALLFPVHSLALLLVPNSSIGIRASKPFILFISHSSSHLFFLFLLVLQSQRIESLLVSQVLDSSVIPSWLKYLHSSHARTSEGSPVLPNLTECFIVLYVLGFFLQEISELSTIGIVRYFNQLWNLVDTLINLLFFTWLFLRSCTVIQVYIIEPTTGVKSKSIHSPSATSSLLSSLAFIKSTRESFIVFDTILLDELSASMFAAASICSFLKLVHIFSVHPHLGPLQISLGRMVYDILKFFFIYTWILFAFACGLYHLLSQYATADSERCSRGPMFGISPFDIDHSCEVWRRFSNLFETVQTLFWASFGLIDLVNFELTGIKEFTRFWSLLMFGMYSIINVVVLLNLLIAMMSDSYQTISACRDTEWKFARSKLWISYFRSHESSDNDCHPSPPFNLLIPTRWLARGLFHLASRLIHCCALRRTSKVKPEIHQSNGKSNGSKGNNDSRCDMNSAEKGSSSSKARDTGKMKHHIYNPERVNKAVDNLHPSYHQVIRGLVRRYVIREQRKTEETGPVTEDDVKEVKQDISTFKFQLFDLLKRNGFKMSAGLRRGGMTNVSRTNIASAGRMDSESDDMSMGDSAMAISRKDRTRERRLLRGFSIGLIQSGHQQLASVVSDAVTAVAMNKSLNSPTNQGKGKSASLRGGMLANRQQRRPVSVDTITMDLGDENATICGSRQSSLSSFKSLFRRTSKERLDATGRREIVKKRWTSAITAIVESYGNPIGSIDSLPSEVKTSIKDLRALVLQERELDDLHDTSIVEETHIDDSNECFTQEPALTRVTDENDAGASDAAAADVTAIAAPPPDTEEESTPIKDNETNLYDDVDSNVLHELGIQDMKGMTSYRL